MSLLLQKTFILGALLVICNFTFAQSDNYIDYYRNIELAYQKGVFKSNDDTTIFFMQKAFSYVSEPLSEDLFVTALAFLAKNNKKQYFEFLLKSIESGLDSSEISKINAYSFLSNEEKDECNNAYQNFQFNIDTLLAQELELVRKEDVRVRNERLNFESKEEGHKFVKFQDSLNREWLINIIKTKGWPGRKLVGNYRASILLVHLDMDWIEGNYNILKEQIIIGNLFPPLLAYKFDYHSYLILKQDILYNSMMPINFIASDEGENQRAIKRWEIGALSREVLAARKYKRRRATL